MVVALELTFREGKSTLSITYKCRQSAAYRLFICTFKDRNRLNVRRLRELVDRLDRLGHVVALFGEAL